MSVITLNIKATSDYNHFLIFIFLVKNQSNVHKKKNIYFRLIFTTKS
jgi:hypothetical protein